MIVYSMFVFVFMMTVLYPLITALASVILHLLEGDRIKRDYTLEPTVTVMMSAFNEGKNIYRTIASLRACDYPVYKMEIMAYDDFSSDDTFIWMERAAQDFPNVVVKRNTENLGKSLTILEMARQSKSEFLVSVDSDCIFEPQCIRELMSGFADPMVGAVGGQFGIAEPNISLLTQMQAIIYAFSFNFLKIVESFIGRVQCLGGPMVSFRRELFLSIIPQIEERSFFGVHITNGEDRAITQFILLKNLKTIINMRARCLVGTPSTWKGYLNQQLRWRRSALGQWLEALVQARSRIQQSSPVTVLGSIVPMMSMLTWLILLFYLALVGMLLPFMASLLLVHMLIAPAIGLVFNLCMKHQYPDQVIDNPILAPICLAVWFPISMFFISIVAIFTLDDGGWVTRQTAKAQS